MTRKQDGSNLMARNQRKGKGRDMGPQVPFKGTPPMV
jgi:hypothetical protein